MKRVLAFIFSLVFVFALSACQKKGFAEMESPTGNNVKREFCMVENLSENNFSLRNTANELYYIDNSFLGNFEVGDNVILLYFNRTSLNDGAYSAEVYAIFPDNNTLVYPTN